MSQAVKHFGWQSCDYCGREFNAQKGEWMCPHCGFDNQVGKEWREYAQAMATARARTPAGEMINMAYVSSYIHRDDYL